MVIGCWCGRPDVGAPHEWSTEPRDEFDRIMGLMCPTRRVAWSVTMEIEDNGMGNWVIRAPDGSWMGSVWHVEKIATDVWSVPISGHTRAIERAREMARRSYRRETPRPWISFRNPERP
jgi:hypothetical protein